MTTNIKEMVPGTSGGSDENVIRVMLVDDSAIIRGLIAKMIATDPSILVTASVADGAQAVKRMAARDIDVIVLDIEMPVMDGLTALPKLIEADPNVKIVMASTLTERNADISLKALEAGAADFHMEIVDSPGAPSLRMNQNPHENFCRPAVGPMLRSVVNTNLQKA